MKRKKIAKRLLCVLLTVVLTFGNYSYSFQNTDSVNTIEAAQNYGLCNNIQDGVILHCFNWRYNDIKAELQNIAEAGFTSIQTSPAQQGVNSGIWYWLYQPLGFYIASNDLGTKAELQSLCTEAHKFGLKVVVDVVANHLAGDHSNIQADLKASQYWHNYGSSINYLNRYAITHGNIGMPDINSENSYVQQCVSNYINELKSIGVDGIRWDAAKHIGLPSEGCDFWPNVCGNNGIWNYGEILKGPTDADSGNEGLMKEYTEYMSVTDSEYGKTLRDAFNSGTVPTAYANWTARGISTNKVVYWAESHDTWSNNKDWGYSNEMSQNVIDRAYAIAASREGASALYFSRPSSTVKENIRAGEKGSTHFISKEVAAVNHFHNAMLGQKEYYTTANNCAVVSREKGAVISKGSGSGYVSVPNGGSTTEAGTYTDAITGNKWVVTSGTISGVVGDTGIAVLLNDIQIVNKPSTTISIAGGEFYTDTCTFTIGLSNAISGTYKIGNEPEKTYTSPTAITIGSNMNYGESITISLKATDGTTTSQPVTYTFKKAKKSIKKAYISLSSGWVDPVYCYAYDDVTGVNNGTWPGVRMTKDVSTGYYVYEIPENITKPRVIFYSSDINRYPANMMPGLLLDTDGTWIYIDGVWKEYIEVEQTTTNTEDMGKYDFTITNISWEPNPLKAGTQTILKATVKNVGNAAAPAGSQLGVKFEISSGNNIISTTWSDNHMSGLKAGEEIELIATGGNNNINYWTAISGTYTVTAHVNDMSTRYPDEENWNNNINTATMLVSDVPTYSVKVDGVEVMTAEPGDIYTLPRTARVGYYSEGKMYKKGSSFTVTGDVNFSSVDLTANTGASIRLADPSGLTYKAAITCSDSSLFTSDAIVNEGMLITTNDIYSEEGSLDFTSEYTYVNIENSGWNGGVAGAFTGTIAGIRSMNYGRTYIARAYMTVKFADGTESVTYSKMTGVRSVRSVATSMKNTPSVYNTMTTAQKALIDMFAK